MSSPFICQLTKEQQNLVMKLLLEYVAKNDFSYEKSVEVIKNVLDDRLCLLEEIGIDTKQITDPGKPKECTTIIARSYGGVLDLYYSNTELKDAKVIDVSTEKTCDDVKVSLTIRPTKGPDYKIILTQERV